jgi:DNA adenine methylase
MPRPPLKWAGGKRWLTPHLVPLWSEHRARRLVEPLCGGLGVAMSLAPGQALLNDINPHVINFYRWLKQGLRTDVCMELREDLYYENRTRFNELVSSGKETTSEAAALFYYLNRTGYNGLCRFNQKGQFNVPFGRYKRIKYQKDFSAYKQAFGRWTFACGDFERLSLDNEDFVYCDPPYDVPFTHYAKEGFGWADQERLACWLTRHPGPVVLSNQATDRIVKLYRSLGFTLKFMDAPRRISCTGDRAPAREVLALRGL